MRTLLIGAELQWQLLRRDPNIVLVLLTVPLTTGILLAIMLHSKRADLIGHVAIAAPLMALWALTLLVSGEVVRNDRITGSLEYLLSSPIRILNYFVGRIALVFVAGILVLGESWSMILLCGQTVPLGSVTYFMAAFSLTIVAMVAWASLAAVAFALVRNVRLWQNSLTFPVYVLSGMLVPVALLPWPVRAASRLLFLSWSADLLRACQAAQRIQDFVPQALALLGFAVLGFGLARTVAAHIERRLRVAGTLEGV